MAVVAGVALAAASTSTASVPRAEAIDTNGHSIFRGEPTLMGQTNGIVFAVKVANNTIFAGGKFTSTRPAQVAKGTQETGQGYLAAFDATTGAPKTTFKPVLRNTYSSAAPHVRAMALSPDQRTLYVGGDFNEINGQRAEHIAKFDVATGAFLGQVGVNGVNGSVASLAVSNDGKTLYAGGSFSKANWGVSRDYVAAFNLETGALRPWYPRLHSPMYGIGKVGTAPISADSLAVSGDDQRVFIGGTFQGVNGTPMQGFAATNASDALLVPGFRGDYNDPGTRNWAQGLAVADGKVYMASRGDDGLQEGITALNAANGTRLWNSGCRGDSMAVLPIGADVYVASHMYLCAPSQFWATDPLTHHAVHVLNSGTGITRPYWMVTGGDSADNDTLWMSRALATDGNILAMGGGFLTANGKPQQNIARFQTGSSAPSRAPWIEGYSCDGCDNIRVRVHLAGDRDDTQLTYRIYRNATTTNPIDTRVVYSTFDNYTELYDFHDYAPMGSSWFYRVTATDPAGNTVWSVRTPTFTVGRSGFTNSTTTAARVADVNTTSVPSLEPATSAQRVAEEGEPEPTPQVR